MVISGPFTVMKTLRKDAAVRLYRGARLRDKVPAIIKALRSKVQMPPKVKHLHAEYAVVRQINRLYLLKPLPHMAAPFTLTFISPSNSSLIVWALLNKPSPSNVKAQ